VSVVKSEQADGTPKRRLKAPARRAVISQAATDLFARKGYDAVSMDEVARASGISRPVLYDHFDSKKDLYLQLLKTQRDQIVEHVAPQLRGEAPVDERLHNTLDAFFAFVQDHPFAWRTLFREAPADPDIAEAQRRLQSEANATMALTIAGDPGVRALAERRGRVALEVAAELVGSALNGLARWWHDRPAIAREQLVSTAMDIFWIGFERIREGHSWQERRPDTPTPNQHDTH
jgi:AcrR family transcriptional regulator